MDGRPVTAEFSTEPEPLVYGFSGCNTYRGAYSIDGDRISFGPTMSTMMACPEGMDTEYRFHRMFEAVHTYLLKGPILEFHDAEGCLLAAFEGTGPPSEGPF